MEDPLVRDHDQLRALATEAVVRRGLACFKENRVLDLDASGGRLLASVQGEDADTTCFVEITATPEGELELYGSCEEAETSPCEHAIAALMSYASRQPVGETAVRNAAEAAVADRMQRGRTEVAVEPIDGSGWPSTWTAHAVGSLAAGSGGYRVEIRSATERMNTCSCPDFAVNQLGTCKHIEAVLLRLRGRGPRKGRTVEPTKALVYVDWAAPVEPAIRLRRPARLSSDAERVLDLHFDAGGALRGELPDALHRLAAAASGLPEIYIGSDALELAVRIGQDAAHRLRAESIRREVERSGGRLAGVKARLYPYQVQGVAFLAANGRAVLADDMGLGKTLQAIAAAAWLMENGGLARVLVICPASLKRQWAREIGRFTDHEVVVVEGGVKARMALWRQRAPFTIANYELVTRDLSSVNGNLVPDLLILDEAQRIKNWRTRTAALIKGVHAERVFVLTGTPLENRLEDLYSVLQIVDPRVLGPLWQFMLRFHVLDERGKVLGYRNLTELRRRLATVMLRRDRRLVRDQLPDRIEHRLDVPMTPKQLEYQDGALTAAASLANILKRRPLTPAEEKRLLSALQTARMACDAAGLVDGETVGSPKLDEVARLLEELCVDGGRKVVIFSQWTRMTEMAEAVAHDLGLGTVRLHGGVPSASRGALIERFHDDPATQVFLSTDAGGVGLNLQCATVLINLDLPWNPAVLEQRIARIHRLGQLEPVQIILVIASPSYEERVGAIVASKRHLFTHVVGEDATEDVIGVSKRTLELALEGLEPTERKDDEAPQPTEVESGPAESSPPAPRDGAEPQVGAPGWDTSTAVAVEALQRALGGRLDRLLMSGGSLLVLVDRLDDAVRQDALDAAAGVPLVVLDTPTWAALRRFSGEVAFAEATEAYVRAEVSAPVDPRLALAHRKLDAARVLRERDCIPDALGSLAAAILSALAYRVGAPAPPTASDAAAWLFGTALPGGGVSADEANIALRIQGLASARSVPSGLLEDAFVDAARLVGGAT
ncbi:MAG: SNF2-related protein [Bradymonadia bacterium]